MQIFLKGSPKLHAKAPAKLFTPVLPCHHLCVPEFDKRETFLEFLFEGTMATCHPSGIAGEVSETSSNNQCAFRLLWKKNGGVFIKRMFIELAMEAREGPDTEDKAEFHMGGNWPHLRGLDGHLSST